MASTRSLLGILVASTLLTSGCGGARPSEQSQELREGTKPKPKVVKVSAPDPSAADVPDWAADAIFYQIFPERFANGDPKNDPTWDSTEFPDVVGDKWRITPWTGDWYARAEWEVALGDNFFDDGVFHRRYGGDIQGILNKLDYLKHLGVNTLYLNPVFYAKSLHKYDGNTYHHIDPYFGPAPLEDLKLMAKETSDPKTWHWTAADKLFLKLVEEVHARGMRIIIDGVFNHTGRDFFAFANLAKEQDKSPYKDWYMVEKFDDPATKKSEFAYKGWWGVDTLPEFANTPDGQNLHPGPKQYVFDSTKRWMDPNGDGDPADGIDGWRLDVANEVPNAFWRDWHQLVRKLNPQAYTVSEYWENAAEYLADTHFSATMNYHGFAFIAKGYLIDGVMTASDAAEQLRSRSEENPPARRFAMQNLIDSHDTDRVASMIVNADPKRPYLQPEKFDYDIGERASPRAWREYKVTKPTPEQQRLQRLVGLLQFTFVGPPMIYYGSEAGMWGGDDPCDRKPMVWPELNYADEAGDPLGRERKAEKVEYDRELASFYQAGLELRAALPALRRGECKFVATDNAGKCLAFKRWDDRDDLFVILNRGDKPCTIELLLTTDVPLAEVFKASGRESNLKVEQTGDRAKVTVPALDGVVLRQFHADW